LIRCHRPHAVSRRHRYGDGSRSYPRIAHAPGGRASPSDHRLPRILRSATPSAVRRSRTARSLHNNNKREKVRGAVRYDVPHPSARERTQLPPQGAKGFARSQTLALYDLGPSPSLRSGPSSSSLRQSRRLPYPHKGGEGWAAPCASVSVPRFRAGPSEGLQVIFPLEGNDVGRFRSICLCLMRHRYDRDNREE
jgi:hypothetical protein